MTGIAQRCVVVLLFAVSLAACSSPRAAAIHPHLTSTTYQAVPSTSTTTPTSFEPLGSSFINPEQGWVLGSAGCGSCISLQATQDGGMTWTALPAPEVPVSGYSQAPNAVNDIYFADRFNGFLFQPGLEMTHDGGETWTSAILPPVMEVTGGGRYLYALAESVGPDSASLWRTTVGSNVWAPLSLPSEHVPFAGVQLSVEGDTLLFLQKGQLGPVRTSSQVGTLWTSTDAASHWVQRSVPCAPDDGGAAVVSIAHGNPDAWLVDCFDNEQSSQAQETQHHLYGSANAGRNWVRLADPSTTGDPALLADNGSGHAFLTTEAGGQDWLMATFDGARSWTRLFATVGFTGWADLQFVDASTGFVVGPSNGYNNTDHVYRTDDGGRTWRVLQFAPSG